MKTCEGSGIAAIIRRANGNAFGSGMLRRADPRLRGQLERDRDVAAVALDLQLGDVLAVDDLRLGDPLHGERQGLLVGLREVADPGFAESPFSASSTSARAEAPAATFSCWISR
jgi:hypothetical protein